MSQFDMHAFVIYLLKNFGPFGDTVEGFSSGMTDGGTYSIEILPDGDGNVVISVKEHDEENDVEA
jgi:hypothetical protein